MVADQSDLHQIRCQAYNETRFVLVSEDRAMLALDWVHARIGHKPSFRNMGWMDEAVHWSLVRSGLGAGSHFIFAFRGHDKLATLFKLTWGQDLLQALTMFEVEVKIPDEKNFWARGGSTALMESFQNRLESTGQWYHAIHLTDRLISWLEEFTPSWAYYHELSVHNTLWANRPYGILIAFAKQSDAVLFKLTWL